MHNVCILYDKGPNNDASPVHLVLVFVRVAPDRSRPDLWAPMSRSGPGLTPIETP